METKTDFNFGLLFKNYLKQHRISKASLARAINRNDSAIIYFQKKPTIQASIIIELCHALKHNFFMEIAMQLPKEYATDGVLDDSKDKKIEQLEQEILLLKAREEVLLKAFGAINQNL